MNHLRKLMLMLPLLSAFIAAAPAQAQQEPQINGFDLEQVEQLTPGTELNFILYGTPRARAALSVEGAQRDLVLVESQPGVYRGVYTISRRDKLMPASTVTANLRSGNRVASAVLDEPLLAGWNPPTPVGQMPRIERLDFLPAVSSNAPPALQMVLYGTPGGRASARIAGAEGRVMLQEGRPGEYRGSYTLRPDERLTVGTDVRANLRVDDRRVSTNFTLPIAASGTPPREIRPVAGGWCAECGVVAAINRVEVNGDGNYVGALAGGVLGAVVGSQVGKGDGRTAAQIAGALGGALAGREIQRRSGNRTEHFEVLVDMRNGGQQTVSYNVPPDVAVGDRVRLTSNGLVRDR
ncbi:MAG: glycine zipper 2TM domain-containing protein [Burkholderiaceae bacterium]